MRTITRTLEQAVAAVSETIALANVTELLDDWVVIMFALREHPALQSTCVHCKGVGGFTESGCGEAYCCPVGVECPYCYGTGGRPFDGEAEYQSWGLGRRATGTVVWPTSTVGRGITAMHMPALQAPKPAPRVPLFHVINTDNFGGDYPDEKFVGMNLTEGDASRLCEKLNRPLDEHSSRWHRVVPDGYVLVPGFEP